MQQPPAYLSHGPMKYKLQTRIGNWSEEWELEQLKENEYQKNLKTGSLKTQVLQQKLDHSLQKASISYSQNGILKFNDRIMINNLKTNGSLGIFLRLKASNIYEKFECEIERYSVTTAINMKPCTRSIFIFEKLNEDNSRDDIIRYGQKFKIIANPRLIKNKKLYLQSCYINEQRFSKISRLQEVSLCPKDSFENSWMIEYHDPKLRFEMNGEPIKLSDQILIKHCFTQQWLASDNVTQKNDFGQEFEVFAKSYLSLQKTHNLVAEISGRTTVDINLRYQESQNLWQIQTAQSPIEEFNEQVLEEVFNIENVIAKLLDNLGQNDSEYSLLNLRNQLKQFDLNNNGYVDQDDFKWGLKIFKLNLTSQELNIIYQHFGDGQNVNIIIFLSELSKENPQKSTIIKQYYNHILNQHGQVTLETLCLQIKAHELPEAKKLGEKQAFNNYINCWNISNKKEIISFEKFNEFYTDISYCILDKDKYLNYLKNTLG